jgi:soluble lytic murein transglycosylase
MKAAVTRHPKGRFATGAAYQVGRLMHEAGRFEKAARQTAKFLKKKRRDPAKDRWFEGWSWFRAKRYAKARAVFAKLAKDDNLLVGPKALYWTARSYALEKKNRLAIKTLRTLRKTAPWSYYGVLGDTLWRTLDPKGYRPLARPAALRVVPGIPDLRAWSPLRPIRQLARTGYPRQGDFDLPKRGQARATAWHARERFGLQWKAEADRRLPWRTGLTAHPSKTVQAAYPPAYLLLAEAAGTPHGVSPWWLLSHMLQESRFKARARSHAGALGTMQVLPRTGLRIAARLGLPRGDFTKDQLFTPGIALRHAAWYLAALRAEFGGSLLLAIAAYNGGPLRFAEHVKAYGDLPFDMMIEEIGAHESRNYVRKVADHLVRFALIYADDAEFLGLIDAIRPLERVPQAKGEVRF